MTLSSAHDRARLQVAGLGLPAIRNGAPVVVAQQIDRFPFGGKQGWDDRFARTGDLGPAEQARVVDVWPNHLALTLPVRFVQLVSAPGDYLLLNPASDWSKSYQLSRRINDPLTMHGALITPERVSPTLLSHLGLVDEGLPDAAIRRSRVAPDVIDGLRCAFLSLRQFSRSDTRLSIVEPAAEALRQLYPGARKVAERACGGLIYFNEQPRVKGGSSEQRIEAAFFASLRSAVRKGRHQESQQHEEHSQVRAFTLLVAGLVPRLDRTWRKGSAEAVKTAFVSEVQSLVRRGFELMGQATGWPFEAVAWGFVSRFG
jgi:hypothetical protein